MEKYLNVPIYKIVPPYTDAYTYTYTLKRYSLSIGIVKIPIQKIKSDDEVHFVIDYVDDSSRHYFSFLKSLLQKSIRRQETEIAVMTCKEMLTIDTLQTIRRLLIIMVEDVSDSSENNEYLITFEKEFIELTFLTCQKEFTWNQLRWCLGLVKCFCEQEYIDIIDSDKIDKISNNLFAAIHLRVSYGGMKCDMKMLNRITHSVKSIKSVKSVSKNDENGIKLIKFSNVPNFKIDPENDTFKASIDFHICNIHYKLNSITKIKVDDIKSLIWIYRSSVNSRKVRKVVEKFSENIEKNCNEDEKNLLIIKDRLSKNYLINEFIKNSKK